MAQKYTLTLANGQITTIEGDVTVLDSGALNVSEGDRNYLVSPAGWWSIEPAPSSRRKVNVVV